MKGADVSIAESRLDTRCVIATYIQPPLYFPVSKPISNKAQELLLCDVALLYKMRYKSVLNC